MLYNGLALVIDLAASQLRHGWIDEHRDALVLGAIRQDVWHVPLLQRITLSPAFDHFAGACCEGGLLPRISRSAPERGTELFHEAVGEAREGRQAAAATRLGRAAHLLIDMACPAHVNRRIHAFDSYENYIEENRDVLSELPIPTSQELEMIAAPRELFTRLAALTRKFPPDPSHGVKGWVRSKFKLAKPRSRAEASRQAHELIPEAAAHTRALFQLFLKESRLDRSA